MVATIKRHHDDDLFKDSTMTFGEHLEELRICLWKAVVGLVLGTLIGLLAANSVVRAIQVPLTKALEQFYLNRALVRYEKQVDELKKQGIEVPFDKNRALKIISEERLVMDAILMETTDLLQQLRLLHPEVLSDTPPVTNPTAHPISQYGPTQVVAGEFSDPVAAARAMLAAIESDNAAARHVLSSPEGKLQKSLQAMVDAPLDDKDEHARLAQVDLFKDGLAMALDPVLDRTDLWNDKAFASATLTSEGLDLLSRKSAFEPKSPELRRINRLLLEAALPGIVPTTRRELVRMMLWRPVSELDRVRPTTLGVQESFSVWLKAALVTGIVLSAPWVFYQVWLFVAAGLYPHEKRYVYIYLPFSIGLFLAGAALAALFVFEPVLNFLFWYNDQLGIDPDPRISEWLGFVLILPLGFGLSFQLPLVMLFMERIGMLTAESYLKNWRISVLIICVVSAILTPADPYSMLLMAIPLVGLFFGGIALCKYMPRGNLLAHWDWEEEPAR